jgi:hypothetical protein
MAKNEPQKEENRPQAIAGWFIGISAFSKQFVYFVKNAETILRMQKCLWMNF